MKKNWFLFVFIIVTFTVSATEQESDLLIIKNDTIYLESFPLEDLKLKQQPFANSLYYYVSSSCWRGYQAVWRICDNKLYLEKILRCGGDEREGEQNVKNLFVDNKIDFQEKNGMILADWVTSSFYEIYFSDSNLYNKRIYLQDGWSNIGKNEKEVLRLKIKNGEIILNRLRE